MKKDTILHAIAKQLVRNWRTPVRSAAYSSALTSALRVFAILFMLMVGVSGVWGQTTGLYYIANCNDKSPTYNLSTPETNYYLVPASNRGNVNIAISRWAWNDDSATPFVTTYQTNKDNNSVWVIKESETSGEYYLIHVLSGKYITRNDGVGSNSNRRSFHMEDPSPLGNDHLFNFTTHSGSPNFYSIKAKSISSGHRFLNPSKANQPYYYASAQENSIWVSGLLGTYNKNAAENDGSKWFLEPAPKLDEPTITANAENNTFSITTDFLPPNCSIRYTTGDGTQDAPTATTGSVTPVAIDGFTNVKAAIVGYGMVLSEIADVTVKCTSPIIEYDSDTHKITLTPTTTGSDSYYRIGDSGEFSLYENPVTVSDGDMIYVYASMAGCINSETVSYKVREVCATPNITVTYNSDGTATVEMACETADATIRYTTDGSTPDENTTDTYSASFVVTAGMTIKAIATKQDCNPSLIATETVSQVATPVIQKDGNTITITCATDGATIWYTKDGGEPISSSTTVTLTLADDVSNKPITAYATKLGDMVTSAQASETIKLQLPTPTIVLGDDGTVNFSIYPSITGVTYKYTIDGTDPSDSNGESCTGSFTLLAPDIVKVMAIHDNYVNSDLYSSYVIPTDIQFLIQNQGIGSWTGVNPFFYLIPDNLNDDGTTKTDATLTTTSLARNTMGWLFRNAGINGDVQYYYIENSSGGRIYIDTDDENKVYVKAFDSNNADRFKFKLEYNETYHGYNIKSKVASNETTSYYLNRTGTNSSEAAINLADGTTHANNLWNIVSRSDFDASVPFTPSNSSGTYFYKLSPNNAAAYFIVPPSGNNRYVTTSNVDSEYMNWYFEEAQAATETDWVTYYYIRNGVTGNYLYFNGSEMESTDAFEMKSSTSGESDRYQFAVVKSPTKDWWLIVPKPLKDKSHHWICSLWRDGTRNLKTTKTRDGTAAKWAFTPSELTLAPPVISFDYASNQITVRCMTPGATVYYTTDGTEATTSSEHTVVPSSPTSTASVTFLLAEGLNTFSAISEKESATAGPVSYSIIVQTTVDDANKRPYLIQSQNNGWTTGDHQGFHYYMVPGEITDGNMFANTTSLFRPEMQWYFKYAGEEDGTVYYNIVNSNGRYLYYHNIAETGYNNGCIYLKAAEEFAENSSAGNYKFFIRTQTAGYNIVPKLKTPSDALTNIHKGSNNNNNAPITVNNGTTGNSLWKFVLKSDFDDDAPFLVSDGSSTTYYKIHNGENSGYYITYPTTSGGKVTVKELSSASEEVQNSMNWYLEKKEDATNDDWLTYYVIRNAITGDYLYYSGSATTPVNTGNDESFETRNAYDESEKGRYLFAWARSYTADRYYIIPQVLKDYNKNNISSLRRNNTKLNINVTRNNAGAFWQFVKADFCTPPVFTESEGNITISCATNGAEIHYKVYSDGDADDNPDESNDMNTTSTSWSASDQHRIKAIAVVKDGSTVTASSAVATLLNRPEITLKEGENEIDESTYTYNGTAKTPTPSKVYIGTTETTAGFALDSTTPYTDNINAGTATVNIIDNDASDIWYILNASTTFVISKKSVTISGITADNKTYDGTIAATLVYGEDYGNVTIGDMVNGDDLTVTAIEATGAFEDAVVGENKTVNITIGSVTFGGTSAANYKLAETGNQESTTANITAAELTVTANNQTKAYGAADPPLTYEVTGFVNSETESVLSGALSRDAGEDVGEYAINKGNLAASNYAITLADNGAKLTITKAALTVTANNQSKVYGDADPELTYEATGFVNSETVSVLSGELSRDAGEDVGDYTILLGDLSASNYAITFADNGAKLTITRATATVTADDKTKGYGDAEPDLTATVTGLKNGDAASVITYTISREGNDNYGTYTITPTGDAVQGNYNVVYVTGTLTIGAKEIGDGTNPAEGIDIDITFDGTNYGVTVKQDNNTIAESNYDWSGSPDTDHPENYVITVTGKGNYTNSAKATYTKLSFYDTTPDDNSTSEMAAVYYNATQNLQVSNVFEAYYVTKLENNTLTITKVESRDGKNNYIPANLPVLLISDADNAPKGFTHKLYTSTDVVDVPATGEGSNLLNVVTDEGGKSVELKEVYIFSMGEFVLSMKGTMRKGKFYLENPAYNTSANARQVLRIRRRGTTSIDNDEITGIDSQSMDSWYTIDGRRLSSKPTKNGLYIKRSEKGKSGSVTVIK